MTNKMTTALASLFMLLSLTIIGSVPAFASSEEELLNTIEDQSGSRIIKYWYDDFDMDGEKEVFAAVGTDPDGRGDSLWFASSAGALRFSLDMSIYCDQGSSPEGICTIDSGQKIFVVECGGGGSGSLSFCAYVKNGMAIPVQHAGENLRQHAGKEFYIHPSAFDAVVMDGIGTGHTWKRYYLKWTGEEFEEYTGTEISREELEGYDGAPDILQQAAAEGYSIGSIWKRDNGIINVNLFREDEAERRNENLTLEYSGNSVTLEVINRGVDEWIQKYSFGGEYEAGGLM